MVEATDAEALRPDTPRIGHPRMAPDREENCSRITDPGGLPLLMTPDPAAESTYEADLQASYDASFEQMVDTIGGRNYRRQILAFERIAADVLDLLSRVSAIDTADLVALVGVRVPSHLGNALVGLWCDGYVTRDRLGRWTLAQRHDV